MWQFWILMIVYLLFEFCSFSIIIHLAPHATDIGFSAIVAANILAALSIGAILGKLIMGSISDKIGGKLAVIIDFGLIVVAMLWLLVATTIWMVFVFAVIFGFAFGSILALMPSITAELFGLKSHGTIFGVITFGAMFGGSLGPVLTGRIFDVTDSYQLAFVISVAVSVIALILFLLLRPTGGKSLQPVGGI